MPRCLLLHFVDIQFKFGCFVVMQLFWHQLIWVSNYLLSLQIVIVFQVRLSCQNLLDQLRDYYLCESGAYQYRCVFHSTWAIL